MPREPATAEPSEWRKRQATQIPIPLSLAYALWDFCCASGRNEDAKHLMDAVEAVLPGFFSSSEAAIPQPVTEPESRPQTTEDTPEALKADIDRLYQMNTDMVNEIERLRAALLTVRQAIMEGNPEAIIDTVWVSDIETAVDFIDTALETPA